MQTLYKCFFQDGLSTLVPKEMCYLAVVRPILEYSSVLQFPFNCKVYHSLLIAMGQRK